jgi:hypothetical protein
MHEEIGDLVVDRSEALLSRADWKRGITFSRTGVR